MTSLTKKSHVVIKNNFKIQKDGVYGLPLLYILSPVAQKATCSGPPGKRPVFSPQGNHVGFACFDTDLKKLIVWEGEKMCNSNGNKVK